VCQIIPRFSLLLRLITIKYTQMDTFKTISDRAYEFVYDVDDSEVPRNPCKCSQCYLDHVLEALPRQMTTYIKPLWPGNSPLYRRINSLINKINELMCPKGYCFIAKTYPWDWEDKLINDMPCEELFTQWQITVLPSSGGEVSIFLPFESYDKACKYFEEIREILVPIYKGIRASELSSEITDYHEKQSNRQTIISTIWDDFLYRKLNSCT